MITTLTLTSAYHRLTIPTDADAPAETDPKTWLLHGTQLDEEGHYETCTAIHYAHHTAAPPPQS